MPWSRLGRVPIGWDAAKISSDPLPPAGEHVHQVRVLAAWAEDVKPVAGLYEGGSARGDGLPAAGDNGDKGVVG